MDGRNEKPSYVERVEAILAAKSIVGNEAPDECQAMEFEDSNRDSDDEDECGDRDGNAAEDDEEYDDALTLSDLCSFVSETKLAIDKLEEQLRTNGNSRREVNVILGDLAKQYGFLEDIQFEIDSLALTTAEEKAIRRERTQEVEQLTIKVSEIEDACAAAIKSIAEKEKDKGNESFKSGDFPAAIEHYTEAISVDPSGNASIYTNRALAYQKTNQLAEGLADARTAVRIDCNYLKVFNFTLNSLSSAFVNE
jgi:tetratricopeptide (TPR) repeat protein